MTPLSFVFVVLISIMGTDVTQVGPHATYGSCETQMNDISYDVETSFKNSFPYGMNTDMWDVNAIIHFDDYSITCERVAVN